jgi:HD-GYP domain-containing protein (c-di-GMP phosphodiesterase class II)
MFPRSGTWPRWRLDGRGYPRGLSGSQLTMPMRMLAVADVYEALTSDRPYRLALSPDRALDLLRANVPGQIDGEVVAALEGLPSIASHDDARRGEAVLDRRRS